jgi:hypothetical protein
MISLRRDIFVIRVVNYYKYVTSFDRLECESIQSILGGIVLRELL